MAHRVDPGLTDHRETHTHTHTHGGSKCKILVLIPTGRRMDGEVKEERDILWCYCLRYLTQSTEPNTDSWRSGCCRSHKHANVDRQPWCYSGANLDPRILIHAALGTQKLRNQPTDWVMSYRNLASFLQGTGCAHGDAVTQACMHTTKHKHTHTYTHVHGTWHMNRHQQ